MDDFQRKARAVEAAIDEWLALSRERQSLREARAANARAWDQRQRKVRMRVIVGSGLLVAASGTAGAALLQTAPGKHPLLEWWPVYLAAVAVIVAFVVQRSQATQVALELAKKADREVIDLKFKGLEDRIDAKLEGIVSLIESLRREIEHSRQRRADTA